MQQGYQSSSMLGVLLLI